jgi:hypothetical protein
MLCALAIAAACAARPAAPAPEPWDSLAAVYAAAVVRWIHPEGLGPVTLCARIAIEGRPMQDEKRIAQAFVPLGVRARPWDGCVPREREDARDAAEHHPALLTVDETLGPQGAASTSRWATRTAGCGTVASCSTRRPAPAPRAC